MTRPPAPGGSGAACHPTLDILSGLISEQQPIFVVPSWFVTADSARVGYLLSELMRRLSGAPPSAVYRSFFANSRFEAMHGAIKLMRHSRLDSLHHHGGRVLVLDGDGSLRRRCDPLGAGPVRALVPGLVFTESIAELRAAMNSPFCGVLIRPAGAADTGALATVAAACRSAGAAVAVEQADLDPATPDSPLVAATRPDLVVFGESLTGHEVPFGAFTGTQEIFSCWSSPATAFLHSNTYGGNSVAMRRVRRAFGDTVQPESRAEVLRLYGLHVNPVTAAMHRRLRGALHVVRARGPHLTVRLDSGRELELVDGLCGAGLGLAGHSPADAVPEVIARHEPHEDYVSRLEAVLAEETGLPHLFPAVSGATAVETAMTLAVLARPRQRRVIVFRHNYAGKTLVSLIGTAADRTRAPFGPLYGDVRYIDPFAGDAADRLRAELATGRVGLVWIELVHGSSDSFAAVPRELLDIVAAGRAERGYLVGVDEILTSYYRCGTRFAHQGRLPEVDLLTLSKALSYGCFPTGAALVSAEVASAAAATNAALVQELRTRHANQLGAHFGLHAIKQADALGLAEKVPRLAAIVADGIQAMDDAGVRRRFAEGLLGQIEPLAPRPLRRVLNPRRLEQAAMLWWITQARVFIVYDVFLLPVNAGEADVRHVMRQAIRLSRTSPYAVLARLALFLIGDRLRAAFTTRAITKITTRMRRPIR